MAGRTINWTVMGVLLACAVVGQAAAAATGPSTLSTILTHVCIFLPAFGLTWLLSRLAADCSKRQAFVRGFVAAAAMTVAEGAGLVIGKGFSGDSEAVRDAFWPVAAALVGVPLGCGIGGGLVAVWLKPKRDAPSV